MATRVLKQVHTARDKGESWNDGARWGGPVTGRAATPRPRRPAKKQRPSLLGDLEASFEATYGKPKKPTK